MAAYNKVCAGCHRDSHRTTENCVGCHMPKTHTDDAVHIVMTDHRIQRMQASPDPTAEKPETNETGGHVLSRARRALLPRERGADLRRGGAGPRRQQFAEGSAISRRSDRRTASRPSGLLCRSRRSFIARPADLPQAIHSFEDALTRAPDSLPILLKLGNALSESREWTRARSNLPPRDLAVPSRSSGHGDNSAGTLWQQDKTRGGAHCAAEIHCARSRNWPRYTTIWDSYWSEVETEPGAEREFREGVRLMPGIAGVADEFGADCWRRWARRQKPSTSSNRAIRFKPGGMRGSRVGFARFLASQGDESARGNAGPQSSRARWPGRRMATKSGARC